MKIRAYIYFLLAVLLSMPGAVLAEDYEYHPALSDSFTAYLGAMRSSNSFKIRADGLIDRGDDIDFDDKFDVSNRSTFFNGQLRWKFGNEKRWSLFGQYFSNNAKGNAELDDDYEWQDVIFGKGTFVEAGIKLSVTRLFFGRSLIMNAQNDFGLGVGIHNLDLSAYVKGEVVIVGNESTGVRRVSVGANQPLPNIGGWYNFSPAKNWLLHARLDWIGANIGDYDGDLWNASAGIGYQAWRHVGFDLSWQYFNLNLDVNSDKWIGSTDLTYSGPVLAVTFDW